MEVIKKGSIESLIVPLKDRLANVNTLASVTSLVFDTKKKSDAAACETGKTVVLDSDNPMWAICEIDSTLAAYIPKQEYGLYIKYTSGSEHPILGPMYFRVEDD
jgi:hypothetical protein